MAAGTAERPALDAAAAPLALIAGGGELPRSVAVALKGRGRKVFVVAIDGEADRDYSGFDSIRIPIGAAAQVKQALVERGCVEVMFAGTIRRPRLSEIDFDLGNMKLALSALMQLRFGGDDRVVSAIVRIFESEGFRVLGPRDAVPEMVAPEGVLGRLRPNRIARADIACGVEAIGHMGRLDIGQAVVALDRRIVAVEAAEGTSAMAERCQALRDARRIAAPPPSGVLVKMLKPGQETRLDMPVIGPDTVRAASVGGLAGIAVEAGGVLLADRDSLVAEADTAGLFVVGVSPETRG